MPPITQPEIDVTPATSLIDEALDLRLTNLLPHQQVTLCLHLRDADGVAWASEAIFRADECGKVELIGRHSGAEEDRPTTGVMSLFTSLQPEGETGRTVPRYGTKPVHITLFARINGSIVAQKTVERRLFAADVQRIDVREEGLIGTLFEPPDGPHPALIVLGGSDGGLNENYAALIASHGFTTLALAYFAAEHLPNALVNIPLEYFETAIRWLQFRPGVQAHCLGVVGRSRGGELALLLGATFPEIKAVVANVPSGIVWPGFDLHAADGGMSQPAWTYRGEPMLFRPVSWGKSEARTQDKPVAITRSFLARLSDLESELERVSIPVERTEGPILLISGEDDQLWPSKLLSEIAVARLTKYEFPFAVEHLCYENAGHAIGIPYHPPIIAIKHPQDGNRYLLGGTAEGNNFAAVDSWQRMLAFLRRHLMDT